MEEFDRYLNDPKFKQWIIAPNDELDLYWSNWCESNPDKAEELERARAFFSALKFTEFTATEERKMDDWRKIERQTLKKEVKQNFSFNYYGIAAAILLLLVAAAGVFITLNKSRLTQQTEIAYIEKITPPGEKLTLQLPDGTFVKLNAGSSLTFPSEFSDSMRIVKLQGEAYFQVKRDVRRPFEVVSGNIVTKVLGTSFNVKSYVGKDVEVALLEGLVEVNFQLNGRREIVALTPGDKTIWANDQFKTEKIDRARDVGWKDNILVFHNHDIYDIKEVLEKWYGVSIHVEGADQMFGSFMGEFNNESLENVLKSIGHALQFQYNINNKTVNIQPKKDDD